jgi:hypothetical protein
MWPVVVVGAPEPVEQRLQFVDRERLVGLGGQPVLEGLLEALHLAAGGGVAGSGVLLDHAPEPELVFESVAAAAAWEARVADGVDHAVEFLRDVKRLRVA